SQKENDARNLIKDKKELKEVLKTKLAEKDRKIEQIKEELTENKNLVKDQLGEVERLKGELEKLGKEKEENEQKLNSSIENLNKIKKKSEKSKEVEKLEKNRKNLEEVCNINKGKIEELEKNIDIVERSVKKAIVLSGQGIDKLKDKITSIKKFLKLIKDNDK